MSKKEVNKPDELENVQHALSASEAFIEKYQKHILFAVAAVVLVVLAVLAFHNYYMEPRENSAENEMAKAQELFAVDSFKVALEGNKQTIGFKEIASEYSITASGNLANAYAGICYYKLGQYENAVKYLTQFDGQDEYFATVVVGLTGDAYVQMGKSDKALDYFEKAEDMNNKVLSPVYIKKAGVVYESQNKPDKALEKYKLIKGNYPTSVEAQDIDKYIARLEK